MISRHFCLDEVIFSESAIRKPEAKSTLFLLKKLFGGAAIRVKEDVNKEELKDWPEEKLAQVHAKKEHKDQFFYEIDRERINEALLKRSL